MEVVIAESESPPEASTSERTSSKPTKKEKKLPACDACKLRRVLCCPQPSPTPCPRCVSKSIKCTTTPVVRKKPFNRTGKRIELAKAVFGTPEEGEGGEPQVSPEGSYSSGPDTDGYPGMTTLSQYHRESLLGLSEMGGILASHLLELAQSAPDTFFPTSLLAPGKLVADFEASGRKLEHLPPLTEVLVHVVIAFAATLSSHRLLIGNGIIPPLNGVLDGAIPLGTMSFDLSEYGRRREGIARQMRDQAASMVHERQAMTICCEENAASCHFMEILDTRLGLPSGRLYASAYAAHIRALADDVDENGRCKLSGTTIHWSPFIMQEALGAHNALRAPAFTNIDQLSIGGPVPPLEHVLNQPSQKHTDLREVFTLLYMPMQSLVHGMTYLARDSVTYIVGTYARSQPLDESRLESWISTLNQLRALLSIIHARLAEQLSPQAVAAFNTPEREVERQLVLRASRYTMTVGWSSLILPVYREMQRRRRAEAQLGYPVARDGRDGRFEDLFSQVENLVVQAARMVTDRLRHDVPSLAYITHLQYFDIDSWAYLVAEESLLGAGGFDTAEQISCLDTLLVAVKRASFAWTHHCAAIGFLEPRLQTLRQEQLARPIPKLQPSQPTYLSSFTTAYNRNYSTTPSYKYETNTTSNSGAVQELSQILQPSIDRDPPLYINNGNASSDEDGMGSV